MKKTAVAFFLLFIITAGGASCSAKPAGPMPSQPISVTLPPNSSAFASNPPAETGQPASALSLSDSPLVNSAQQPPEKSVSVFRLPKAVAAGEISVEEAIAQRRSVREYSGAPLTLKDISQMLWAAQGVTQPHLKLRSAPSAGALYPLEVYLICADGGPIPAGVYHYNPNAHTLEIVISGNVLAQLHNACLSQDAASPRRVVLFRRLQSDHRKIRIKGRDICAYGGRTRRTKCLSASRRQRSRRRDDRRI